MTGILDRIRSTTPETLAGVTGDFSDAPAATYRPRVPRDMIRTVEGADDLKVSITRADRNSGAGMIRTDGTGKIDTRPFKGMPTDRQMNFIHSLTGELYELDQEVWSAAVDYNNRMTENQAWNPARDENVSRWITRLKAKIAELKVAAAAAPVVVPADGFADVPDGRYAVQDSGSGDWKFYRLTTGGPNSNYPGVRFLKVQASDDFHLIRNRTTRHAVLNSIRAMGVKESMIAYGQHIGACGRCGRTLTDEVSRSRGIGPDCWDKL
jgi:hypothetical protein